MISSTAAVMTMLGQPLTGQQRTARDANVQTLVSRLNPGAKSTIGLEPVR
jgi:hypothetical protein